MNTPTPRRPFLDRGWHWLGAAAVLNLLIAGPRPLALAAWFVGMCTLRFLRLNPTWRGFAAVAVATGLTSFLAGRGFVPLPDPVLLPMMLVAGTLALVPFLADRLLARRIGGFAGTLVLPLASVAWYFLDARVLNPYGSWGNPVYTQADNAALLQTTAFVGIWGILFLMAWTASVANWIWEHGVLVAHTHRGWLWYVAVLLVAVVGGEARLAFAAPARADVPVAAVVTSSQQLLNSVPSDALGRLLTGTGTAQDNALLHAGMAPLSDELLAQSAQAAQAGARIIVWPEGSLLLGPDDEAALQRRAAALARNNGVYLVAAYAVLHQGAQHENKAVVFDPRGAQALEYTKHNLVPFAEDSIFERGAGMIPTLDTPYGRLAVVICHDQDHHEFVAQAGRQGADLLIIPTGDWKTIDQAHQRLGMTRAVEQGLTVLRATRGGLSAVIDPQGRILASMDRGDVYFDRTPVQPALPNHVSTMFGRAPASGMPTLYRTIGDAFAWLCVAGLAGFAVATLRRRWPRVAVPAAA